MVGHFMEGIQPALRYSPIYRTKYPPKILFLDGYLGDVHQTFKQGL